MFIVEDLEYFKSYKRNLHQFIILNCCYPGTYNAKGGRIPISAHEMLGLLKEISRIENHIAKIQDELGVKI
jgi:hypothetical protein|tara:strand:- start:13 stop:225 length:213 start_codon:yes stop_codon:yes gene_type:complete